MHEGHVVCDELLRVVGLRDGGQDAHDERDRRRLGRVVEGLPDGDLQLKRILPIVTLGS